MTATAATPPVSEPAALTGLDLHDAFAPPADASLPPPPLGALRGPLQDALTERDAQGLALARHFVRPLQQAIPPKLAAALAPVAQALAPVLARRRQIDPTDHSRGAEAGRWLLDRDLEGIRVQVAPALEPALAAAEQAFAAVEGRADAILAAAQDVPALDPPGRAALGDLLAVLPHLDGAERIARLEALIAPALRAPMTPAARGFLRHVTPIVRSLARGVDPTRDDGIRLGALLFAAARASESPEAVAARRVKTYVELARFELPKLARALAGELGTGEAQLEAHLAKRSLMFFAGM